MEESRPGDQGLHQRATAEPRPRTDRPMDMAWSHFVTKLTGAQADAALGDELHSLIPDRTATGSS